jgi:putative transposase
MNGEKSGFPHFQGRNRYHSCTYKEYGHLQGVRPPTRSTATYKEYGNGARLDNGSLVLAKIERIAVRWSRPVEGAIKTVTVSKEADG